MHEEEDRRGQDRYTLTDTEHGQAWGVWAEVEGLGPWLLEDTESPGPPPGTDGLVPTGLDDYEGPPDGHRASVRLHERNPHSSRGNPSRVRNRGEH